MDSKSKLDANKFGEVEFFVPERSVCLIACSGLDLPVLSIANGKSHGARALERVPTVRRRRISVPLVVALFELLVQRLELTYVKLVDVLPAVAKSISNNGLTNPGNEACPPSRA